MPEEKLATRRPNALTAPRISEPENTRTLVWNGFPQANACYTLNHAGLPMAYGWNGFPQANGLFYS